MSDVTDDLTGTVAGAVAPNRAGAKEFIVEFLGSLVPGGAFLFALVFALVLPVVSAARRLFVPTAWSLPGIDGIATASVGVIVFLVVPVGLAFLVFAYIAGHLFYRQDPKVADEASYRHIPRSHERNGMVREIPTPDNHSSTPVEFPYHFLKQYLQDRGIEYLAKHVPWDMTDDPHTFRRRAKHWANALKIRIGLECPQHYGLLARNEAHVRLSSSMWYVCRALLQAAAAGLAVEAGVWAVLRICGLSDVHLSPVVLGPAFVMSLSWLAKWSIEKTLHYQREREVLFILETAHWLWATGRAPRMFEGLEGNLSNPPPPPPGRSRATGLPALDTGNGSVGGVAST